MAQLRSLLPVPLIPAAWAMTVATAVYPGIDIYWIRHMHGFMVVFLSAFAVLSWREMDSEVLEAWRNVILLGVPLTALGMAGLYVDRYATALQLAAVGYWILAPAYGFWITGREMDEGSFYIRLSYLSVPAALAAVLGALGGFPLLLAASLVAVALIQLASMVKAVKMDGDRALR